MPLSRQHAPFEHVHHPGPRLPYAPAHSVSLLGVPVYKPSHSLTSRFRLALGVSQIAPATIRIKAFT